MSLQITGRKRRFSWAVALVLTLSLLNNGIGWCSISQGTAIRPESLRLVPVSPKYSCPVLVGLKLHPDNPQKIDFIFDTADKAKLDDREAARLVKYFMAGLTIPSADLWVNLSPYEPGRIVTPSLSITDLGKDMLDQDYLLKQLSASLTYPESEAGKAYWAAIQGKNQAESFNKVWIVPDKAEVYEGASIVLITKSSLKAMVQEDYLAMEKNGVGANNHSPAKSDVTQAFKAKILPIVNSDVNNGKNFATLRQAYNSLILAVWFKEKFNESFFKYYLNQAKVKGIDITDKNAKEKIYARYVEAFKAGAYNYIKSERVGANNNSPVQKITKRAYFSGGADLAGLAGGGIKVTDLPPVDTRPLVVDEAGLAPQSIATVDRAADEGDSVEIAREVIQREFLLSALASNAINISADALEAAVADAVKNGSVEVPVNGGVLKIERHDQVLTLSYAPASGDKLYAFAKTVTLAGRNIVPTQAVLFRPTMINYDPNDRTPIPAGYFTKFRKNDDAAVISFFEKAQAQGIGLSAWGYARGIDIGGTSLDLPQWQLELTPRGVSQFNDYPATSTTTTNYPVKLRFELLPPGNEDVIEYVAPSYGITADKPLRVTGEVQLDKNGRTNQAHAPAYIFRNLFGLKGIRIICDEIDPMVLAGGLESSNVVNTALIAAASMLTGAGLSQADIFATAVRLENNDLGGLTGGQGHGSVLLGGANLLVWLSGVRDAQGQLTNPYSFMAVPLTNEAGIKAIEEHVMLAQAGKGYLDGNAVIPRTADLVNKMWTFVLEASAKDPSIRHWFTRQVALLSDWRKALATQDFEAAGKVADEIVDIRDQVQLHFVQMALRAQTGIHGLPAYAEEFRKLLFDESYTVGGVCYYNDFKLVRALLQSHGADWLEAHSLYDLDPIATLVKEGRAAGIHLIPLGAGGPGANLGAVSAHGTAYMTKFFQEHGMGEIEKEEARHMIANDPAYAAREYVKRTNLAAQFQEHGVAVNPGLLESAVARAIATGSDTLDLGNRGQVQITRNYNVADKSTPLDQQNRSLLLEFRPAGASQFLGTKPFSIEIDAGLTMRGYSPLKIGREGMQFVGFREAGMILPAGGQKVATKVIAANAPSLVGNLLVRGDVVVQSDTVKIGIDNSRGFSPRDVKVALNGKIYNLLTEEPGVGDPAFTMEPTVNRLELEGEWVAPDGTVHKFQLNMDQAKALQEKGYMLVLPGEPGPIHGLLAWAPWQVTHNPDGSATGVADTNIEGVPELFQGLKFTETHAARDGRWVILNKMTHLADGFVPVGTGVHFWWNANPRGKTAEGDKVTDRAQVKVQFSADFAYVTDPSKNGRWPTGDRILMGSEAAAQKRFGFDKGQVIGEITPETIFDDVFHLKALPAGVDHQYVTIYDPITNTTKIIKASPEYRHVVVFTPFWPGSNGALCVEVQTDATNKFHLQKVARERGDTTLGEAVKGIVLDPKEEKTLEMEVWMEQGEVTVEQLQQRELTAKGIAGEGNGSGSAGAVTADGTPSSDVASMTADGALPPGGIIMDKIKVGLHRTSGKFYFKSGFSLEKAMGLTADFTGNRSQKTIKALLAEDGLAQVTAQK